MYKFELPDQLIAQSPAAPRDSAKLLVYSIKDRLIYDTVFSDIGNYLKSSSTLAVNNSKVDNCRWLFGTNVEIFVLEKNDPTTIRAMVKPGRKFKLGKTIRINDWLNMEVLAVDDEGIRTLRLSVSHDDHRLKEFEHIPLPPYISQNDQLADEYQTVYAKPLGSLAAPTAGLHFTDKLMSEIKENHHVAELTLHVGLGTFAKLSEENLRTGKLHEESYLLDIETCDLLNSASHLTAVGTTTIRTLESAVGPEGLFIPGASSTDIFIRPGYKFKKVDSLITNFHLPSTSLLMLIAAFIADRCQLSEHDAEAELMRIYNHAISNKYRFYSFGDAMMIV